MTFFESISTCFSKYATFTGTATRSEFWWFYLFIVLVTAILTANNEMLANLFSLATFIPIIAAGARRMHDTDRSGWWQLLWFIPVIGWIVVIVFLVQEGKPNRYQGESVIPA